MSGKNVLVIAGSPRRNGNSEMLCDAFIRGAEKAGNIVEKITLSGKKLASARHVTPVMAEFALRKMMPLQS